MSLSGKANGTLDIWTSNTSLPLWPNSTADAVGWSTFVLPATSSARAVEAASDKLVVEYVAYGTFGVAPSRSERHSTADETAAHALGGVVLGPPLSGDGYATFGTGVGREAVLVIAKGSGGSAARTALQNAGVLLWYPPPRLEEDGRSGWMVAAVIAAASLMFAFSPRGRGSHP